MISTFGEGNLKVKLPTVWTDGKAEAGRVGKSQRGEESKRRREGEKKRENQRRKSEKQKNGGTRNGRKVAIHCIFPMVGSSGGSKGRLGKAAAAEACCQMRNEKLHTLWHEAHVQAKVCKTHHIQNIFGS